MKWHQLKASAFQLPDRAITHISLDNPGCYGVAWEKGSPGPQAALDVGQPLWEGTSKTKQNKNIKKITVTTKKKEVSPRFVSLLVGASRVVPGVVVELSSICTKCLLDLGHFSLEEPPTALLRSCCFMELFILVLLFALRFDDEIKAFTLQRHRHSLFCRCCSCPEAFERFPLPGLLGSLFCSENVGKKVNCLKKSILIM